MDVGEDSDQKSDLASMGFKGGFCAHALSIKILCAGSYEEMCVLAHMIRIYHECRGTDFYMYSLSMNTSQFLNLYLKLSFQNEIQQIHVDITLPLQCRLYDKS